ncbi:cell division protein ZapA [bacterium]|nr:cell division protein ZapA [bacterium]
MKTIEVHINGRFYNLACDDGEEDRLRRLGAAVDHRMKDLKSRVPGIQDPMLWVMTALMLADEAHDSRQEAERLKRQSGGNGASVAGSVSEDELLGFIDSISSRIESIAESLENV